jgi:trk system potassium uptake protein TrkH
MAELIMRNHYELEKAFRVALFQVVSFISTTGLFNDDAAKWPHITWVLLAVCMFIGGCAGSTAGGFKCIRGVMLIKVVRNQFKQLLHPNAVLPLKIDGQNVEQQKRVTLLAFLTVYLLICLVMSFVLIAAGIDSTNSITIILSCIGNVGPTLGIEIGPTMSWADLPVFVKWICSFVMLVGRLEIFSVLIIFTPQFWTK